MRGEMRALGEGRAKGETEFPPLAGLQSEAFAVGALDFGGICLVGAHLNGVQRAVIAVLAMVGALGDRALDGLVRGAGTTGHNSTS